MVRGKMTPEIGFAREIDLPGIDAASRDHDVQLHKKEVYRKFTERLKKVFPESDLKTDTFSFGLGREEEKVA